jgi:hypothetical protein
MEGSITDHGASLTKTDAHASDDLIAALEKNDESIRRCQLSLDLRRKHPTRGLRIQTS